MFCLLLHAVILEFSLCRIIYVHVLEGCFHILLRGSLGDNPGPIYNVGVMSQEDLDLGRSMSKIIAETHLFFCPQ